jgi:hypothetical protein
VRRVVTRLTQAFPGPLRTGKGVVLRDLGPEKFHLCRRKWCGCATRTPPLRVFPRDTLDFCSRQPLRTISFARGVIVGYLLGHLRTDECGSEGQSRGVGSHVRVDAEVNRFGQKLSIFHRRQLFLDQLQIAFFGETVELFAKYVLSCFHHFVKLGPRCFIRK